MPEDDRSYRKSLAVGTLLEVRIAGRWRDATVISKSERGKSESVLAQTVDGTVVSLRDPSQWRALKTGA